MPTHIPQHQRQAPAQQPANPNQLMLEQMVQAMGQQQQLAQQAPQPRTGFLAPGQEGARDVLTNPSQEQLTAALTGLLHAANPNSRAPLLSGFAGGMSALQSQRAREFQARQQAYDAQTKQLQQRIENLGRTAGVSDQIQGRQLDVQRLGLDRSRFGLEREEFGLDQQQFQEDVRQSDREFQLQIAKERDIFEDQVGTDEMGNPVVAKFSRNPITGDVVQLSGGISTTTQKQRTEMREVQTKGTRALREGADLFFDPKLHQIFGPVEFRPLVGGLTEGRVAGDAKAIQGRYDRFVQERILDVARILAPVTDVDVENLKRTLAPQKALGSAEEAREWFTRQFAPKVITEARMASPLTGMSLASQFAQSALQSRMDTPEAMQATLSVLGHLPFTDEVMGFDGSPEVVYTPFEKDDPLYGRAIPLEVLKAMAKRRGVPLQQFIRDANMQEVRGGQR